MKRLMMVMIGVLALVASACGGDITEQEFKDQLMEDGGVTSEQADCVVEGLQEAGISLQSVTDEELGDNDPPPEALEVIFACLLGGASEDVDTGGATPDVNAYGDDPAFDALYDQCEAGDAVACDDLFWTSPLGSEYEAFGNTCGNRFDTPPMSCEEAMG